MVNLPKTEVTLADFGYPVSLGPSINLLTKTTTLSSYLQLPMQSVPITTNVTSSNPAQARCTRYHILNVMLFHFTFAER